MKRRRTLIVVALGVMVAVALIAAQKPKTDGKLLLLEWADKSSLETPPLAVLIEFGTKDAKPTTWDGKATVSGAKVVHREGYHFREGDLLTEPDGWLVSSRRPIRVPPRLPAVARTEGVDPAGIVLHLADVKDDAELTIELKSKEQGKVSVALKDLLSGKHVPILGGSGRVRVITTATPVANAKTEDDFPAACYGPDGTLWVAYVAYHIRDEDRRIEQKPLKMQPENFKAMYTPEFGDQAMVKYYRKGKWSDSFAVTDAKQDIVRCAIAAEGDGNVWVVYSANRNNNHDIFARKLDLNTPAAVSHPRHTWGRRNA